MKKPFFTIGIPVYNRIAFIEQAVESVLKQDFHDYELIVVDNNSNDGTWEFLNSIKNSKMKVFRNKNNIGMVRNWVRCVEESTGEWFKFLMSDDVLLDGALNRICEILKSKEKDLTNSFIYISNGVLIDTQDLVSRGGSNGKIETIDRLIFEAERRKYKFGNYSTMPNAYAIRTDILKKIISSNKTGQMILNYGDTGHNADYYLFVESALNVSHIVQDPISTYAVRRHKHQGMNKYINDIHYHLVGDRYVNNLIFDNRGIERIHVFKHATRTLFSKLRYGQHNGIVLLFCSYLKFLAEEIMSILLNTNKASSIVDRYP